MQVILGVLVLMLGMNLLQADSWIGQNMAREAVSGTGGALSNGAGNVIAGKSPLVDAIMHRA